MVWRKEGKSIYRKDWNWFYYDKLDKNCSYSVIRIYIHRDKRPYEVEIRFLAYPFMPPTPMTPAVGYIEWTRKFSTCDDAWNYVQKTKKYTQSLYNYVMNLPIDRRKTVIILEGVKQNQMAKQLDKTVKIRNLLKPGDRVHFVEADMDGVIFHEINNPDEYDMLVKKYKQDYGVDFEETLPRPCAPFYAVRTGIRGKLEIASSNELRKIRE